MYEIIGLFVGLLRNTQEHRNLQDYLVRVRSGSACQTRASKEGYGYPDRKRTAVSTLARRLAALRRHSQ